MADNNNYFVIISNSVHSFVELIDESFVLWNEKMYLFIYSLIHQQSKT